VSIRFSRKVTGANFMNQSLYISTDLSRSAFHRCGLSKFTPITASDHFFSLYCSHISRNSALRRTFRRAASFLRSSITFTGSRIPTFLDGRSSCAERARGLPSPCIVASEGHSNPESSAAIRGRVYSKLTRQNLHHRRH